MLPKNMRLGTMVMTLSKSRGDHMLDVCPQYDFTWDAKSYTQLEVKHIALLFQSTSKAEPVEKSVKCQSSWWMFAEGER